MPHVRISWFFRFSLLSMTIELKKKKKFVFLRHSMYAFNGFSPETRTRSLRVSGHLALGYGSKVRRAVEKAWSSRVWRMLLLQVSSPDFFKYQSTAISKVQKNSVQIQFCLRPNWSSEVEIEKNLLQVATSICFLQLVEDALSAPGIGRIKLEKHPAGSARRSSVLQLMVCMGYYLNLKRKGASKNGLLINLAVLGRQICFFQLLGAQILHPVCCHGRLLLFCCGAKRLRSTNVQLVDKSQWQSVSGLWVFCVFCACFFSLERSNWCVSSCPLCFYMCLC